MPNCQEIGLSTLSIPVWLVVVVVLTPGVAVAWWRTESASVGVQRGVAVFAIASVMWGTQAAWLLSRSST